MTWFPNAHYAGWSAIMKGLSTVMYVLTSSNIMKIGKILDSFTLTSVITRLEYLG